MKILRRIVYETLGVAFVAVCLYGVYVWLTR